jgi:hypothetical protein
MRTPASTTGREAVQVKTPAIVSGVVAPSD